MGTPKPGSACPAYAFVRKREPGTAGVCAAWLLARYHVAKKLEQELREVSGELEQGQARIQVGHSRSDAGESCFFVKDNGVGFGAKTPFPGKLRLGLNTGGAAKGYCTSHLRRRCCGQLPIGPYSKSVIDRGESKSESNEGGGLKNLLL